MREAIIKKKEQEIEQSKYLVVVVIIIIDNYVHDNINNMFFLSFSIEFTGSPHAGNDPIPREKVIPNALRDPSYVINHSHSLSRMTHYLTF